jgi:hypothetical protein
VAGTRRRVIDSLRSFREGAVVIYLALEPKTVTAKEFSRKQELDTLHLTADRETMRRLRLTLRLIEKIGESQCDRCVVEWLLRPREALGGSSVLRYIKENSIDQARERVKLPPIYS